MAGVGDKVWTTGLRVGDGVEGTGFVEQRTFLVPFHSP